MHRRAEDLKDEMIYVKIEEEATPAGCSQRLPPHMLQQKRRATVGVSLFFPGLPRP